MSPNIFQFKGAYEDFVLCKILIITCERKHEHFTNKYNRSIAHIHETRSSLRNKKAPHLYSMSKCQNALLFRGLKL